VRRSYSGLLYKQNSRPTAQLVLLKITHIAQNCWMWLLISSRHSGAHTLTAARYTMTATAMKTWKTNGILLKKSNSRHHTRGIATGRYMGNRVYIQISPSYVWSSWFVAVMVVAITVIVCGHHGHCLWPSWSLFVAIMVCGRHCWTRHSAHR